MIVQGVLSPVLPVVFYSSNSYKRRVTKGSAEKLLLNKPVDHET